MTRYVVKYKVVRREVVYSNGDHNSVNYNEEFSAGPYNTYDEAYSDFLDIRGYEGVSGAYVAVATISEDMWNDGPISTK